MGAGHARPWLQASPQWAGPADRDTLIQHPAALTHRPVASEAKPGEDIARLSIGLENPDDVVADLCQALEAARGLSPEPARRRPRLATTRGVFFPSCAQGVP